MQRRQRGRVRLRREYPPEFGQHIAIGPFAISETHSLVVAPEHLSMRTLNIDFFLVLY
jgi:hypothetical protein